MAFVENLMIKKRIGITVEMLQRVFTGVNNNNHPRYALLEFMANHISEHAEDYQLDCNPP